MLGDVGRQADVHAGVGERQRHARRADEGRRRPAGRRAPRASRAGRVRRRCSAGPRRRTPSRSSPGRRRRRAACVRPGLPPCSAVPQIARPSRRCPRPARRRTGPGRAARTGTPRAAAPTAQRRPAGEDGRLSGALVRAVVSAASVWHADVSPADARPPCAPCCCCAGATPATRRAAAARPTCSASARSWPQSGVEVTLRTARYPGAPRREVVDGVRISRGGGPYSVYIWAGLAMVAARIGLGPLRRVRPDVVIDTQNGLPFLARLALRPPRRGARAPLPPRAVAGRRPVDGPVRLVRRVAAVAVAAPAQPVRDRVTAVGARPRRPRRGRRAGSRWCATDSTRRPPQTLDRAASATPAGRRCCPGWCRTSRSRTRWTPSPTAGRRHPGPAPRHRRRRLVARPPGRPRRLLGISDAVTFHGHVDDVTKHQVLQRSWVHVLPSRKEGWGLAVTEAAQHAVPTIGYRSSGGLTDSIVDGVTGLLVDDQPRTGRPARRAADAIAVLREQLGAQSPGPQRRVLLAAERRRDAHRAGGGVVRAAGQRSAVRLAAPGLALAVAVLSALSACGAGSPAPTCDDYANADPIARKMMVSDELQRHGLDYARTDLHLMVNDAVAQHCRPLDPYGHVKARKNGSQPFAATVNWAGLQANRCLRSRARRRTRRPSSARRTSGSRT